MAAVAAGIAIVRRLRVSAAGLALLLAVLGASGCAQPGRPPVADRSPLFAAVPDSYEVRPGDTLYSIAWRFGFDHRALARANGIAAPYAINVGQTLRLRAPPPRRATAATPSSARRPAAEAPARRPSSRTPGAAGASSFAGRWRAPTDAPVQRGFGNGNSGIDYALRAQHRVQAAAAGEVVYAGSGLGGFRHLVIIKHDPAHLSAYSLNGALLVREGQRVGSGERIAARPDRGLGDELHFEIRRNGQPVDPRPLIGG